MKFTYPTTGVCATNITIDTDGDTILSVEFENGCNGNTKGISKLVEGMKIDDVIRRLDGVKCGRRSSSCPEQLAKALQTVER